MIITSSENKVTLHFRENNSYDNSFNISWTKEMLWFFDRGLKLF